MREDKGKRLLAVYLLEILKKYSDAAHPLSGQWLLILLDAEYGARVERKAVQKNLETLLAAGFPVRCSERTRTWRGRTLRVRYGWYFEHTLAPEDFRILRELLAFSAMTYGRARQLAEKLLSFGNRYTPPLRGVIKNLPDPSARTRLEKERPLAALLEKAVEARRKVSFFYDHYEADGKWHHNPAIDGTDRVYKVNPYGLLASGGAYFLVGNPDGEETVRLYRVGRMSGLTALAEPIRPVKSVEALADGVHPARHAGVLSRVYFGEAEKATLEAAPEILSCLTETFGDRLRIVSATAQTVRVEVEAPLSLLRAFALSACDKVRVTGPPLLVREVKRALSAAEKNYGGF